MDELDLILEASISSIKVEQAEMTAQGAEVQPQTEEPIPEQGPDVQPQEAAPQGTEVGMDQFGAGMDPAMGGMDGMGMDGMYGQPPYEPPEAIEEPLDIDEVAPNPKQIVPITYK